MVNAGYLLAFFSAVAVAAPVGLNWQIETVDRAGAGNYTSMQADAAGNVHLAYVAEDGGSHTLKYAFWQKSLGRWFTMIIDERAGFCSLALDSKERPRISYVDYGAARGAKLRYAYWDGSSWKKQSIPVNADAIGYYTSIALDAKDRPTISFYEYEGAGGIGFVLRMRTVTWNDSFWEARTIDNQGGSGKFNSIAVDSKGSVHVAYANVKAESAGLRYGYWNGTAWQHETIEGATQAMPMQAVRVIVDRLDNPHLVYSDVGNGIIKYATRRDGKWQVESVDSVGRVAYPDRNGIALDEDGTPYLSYYDAGAGTLKMAYRVNGRWYSGVVDRNFAGFTSSIQVDKDYVWLSYSDQANRALKVARAKRTGILSLTKELRGGK